MKFYVIFVAFFFIISCKQTKNDINTFETESTNSFIDDSLESQRLDREYEKFMHLKEGETLVIRDTEKLNKNIHRKINPNSLGNSEFQKFAGKKFTIKSTSNDKEFSGKIIQTNNETTYHTFDFKSMNVTLKTPLNGKWLYFSFPMNGFYVQEGKIATTYVIEVNDLGVNEIWFSLDVPNLGYDYADGSRIACYDLVQTQ